MASARGRRPVKALATSSAKWRPCRLSRKARTSSGTQPVASAMAAIAIGQAEPASAWWAMPLWKPQAGLTVAGTLMMEAGGIGLAPFG